MYDVKCDISNEGFDGSVSCCVSIVDFLYLVVSDQQYQNKSLLEFILLVLPDEKESSCCFGIFILYTQSLADLHNETESITAIY